MKSLLCLILFGAAAWLPGLSSADEGSSAITDGRLRVEYVAKGNMMHPSSAISLRLRISPRGNFLDDKAVIIPDDDLRKLVENVSGKHEQVLVVLDVADASDTTVKTLTKAIDRLASMLPKSKKAIVVIRE